MPEAGHDRAHHLAGGGAQINLPAADPDDPLELPGQRRLDQTVKIFAGAQQPVVVDVDDQIEFAAPDRGQQRLEDGPDNFVGFGRGQIVVLEVGQHVGAERIG